MLVMEKITKYVKKISTVFFKNIPSWQHYFHIFYVTRHHAFSCFTDYICMNAGNLCSTHTNVRKTKFSLWFKKSKMEQKYFEFRGYIKLATSQKSLFKMTKTLKGWQKEKYLGKCTMLRDEV
jgi:hypothetical protein